MNLAGQVFEHAIVLISFTWAVWLADPGPEEVPGLLGGLGGFGGAGHDRIDVGQALADLQGDVNSGAGCGGGQALGVAEQYAGAPWGSSCRAPG